MTNNFVSLGFLSYKPDTQEFFYNVSCQLSETLLFSAFATVVVDGQIGFIHDKNVECTSVEVYNAFAATLLNNINNFGERYGTSFHDTFKYDFSLKKIDVSDNFYLFTINKNVQCNREGYHRETDGHIVKYKYIVEPTEIPVYNASCSRYNRESVDISDNDLDYELNNVVSYNYSNLKGIRRDLITIINYYLCCFAQKKAEISH